MAAVSFSINAIDKTRAAFAQVDRGLKNLINGGDATQKKLLSMGLQAVGLGSILTVLASQIIKVATETEKVPGISRETIDSWDRLKHSASTTGGVLQNMVAKLGEGFSDLRSLITFGAIAAVKGLDAAQKDLLKTDALIAAAKRDSSGAIDKEIDSMRKLGEARKQYMLLRQRESTGDSIMRQREEAALLERQAAGTEDLAKRNNLLTSAVKLRYDAEKDLVTLEDKVNDAQAKRIAGEEDVRRVWQDSTKSLRELNAEREKTERLLGQASKAVIGGDLGAMEEEIRLNEKLVSIDKDRVQIMRKQKDLATQVGDSVASSFEEAVFSGGKLRSVLKGIAEDVARILFRRYITNGIAGAISGGLSKLLGGDTPAAAPAADTVPIVGKAVGGPVSMGTSYLVGEKGPEIFTPSQAGRIIPNHDMGKSGGGGGNTYIIDARGADAGAVHRIEGALFALAGPGQVERRALGAYANAKARGGRF